MLKSIVQGLAALCLFLAVLLFPTKVGLIISEAVQACWNIVITVGKNIRVPGEGVAMLGMLGFAPIGSKGLAKNKGTHLMKTLRTMPSRLTAQAHASAFALEAGSSRLTRAQIGSSIVLGLLVLFTSNAFAGPRDNIVNLVVSISNFLLMILAAAVIGMACWGAFLYVTSAGNRQRVDMAKETVKNVFIGLAIAAAIFLIRSVVLDFVGGVDGGGGGNGIRNKLKDGGL